VVIDPFAEVCCLFYELFHADITADEIDAVIRFAGEVSRNFVTATCTRTSKTLCLIYICIIGI
jgi:hypothetical protein